tara:strand:+ start:1466 stop:1705 length:240 start_codon:yes stop_codon:yes gene_type:complete
MRSYLKYIIYFALSFVDSLINLVTSLFRVYPGSDMSGTYLANRELKRTLKWDISHQNTRRLKAESSLDKMEKAKRDSGV